MTEQLPLDTSPLPVKLRVEDYLLLDGSGAFADYAKTELIDGEIVYMNAQHRPHARIKTELAIRLHAALQACGSDLAMLIEAALKMPPHNVPEPDILLTREPYGQGLVPLESVALVVEVADATLANDLRRKAMIYAVGGVPEYWVVDVAREMVIRMWMPAGGAYTDRDEVPLGSRIGAATIAGLHLPATSD